MFLKSILVVTDYKFHNQNHYLHRYCHHQYALHRRLWSNGAADNDAACSHGIKSFDTNGVSLSDIQFAFSLLFSKDNKIFLLIAIRTAFTEGLRLYELPCIRRMEKFSKESVFNLEVIKNVISSSCKSSHSCKVAFTDCRNPKKQ